MPVALGRIGKVVEAKITYIKTQLKAAKRISKADFILQKN